MTLLDPKIVAFHLPQFYPTPDNDAWWGRGFTDWRNVVKARPRFRGHYQPHLPSDLGFYDLRVPETRAAQAEMARDHGVHGFCYFHYWYNGRRVIEKPVDAILESGEPDFPFMLCWANHDFTRIWNGSDQALLLTHEYTDDDYRRHARHLLRYFADRRYIRVDGKPFFLLYQADKPPQLERFVDHFQQVAREEGFSEGLYLAFASPGFLAHDDAHYMKAGFDACVDIQPGRNTVWAAAGAGNALELLRRTLPAPLYNTLKRNARATKRLSYPKYVDTHARGDWPAAFLKFPCVFPSWDNTARSHSAIAIQNLEGAEFAQFLDAQKPRLAAMPSDRQFLFVNAWNEWAEGCHLEPDSRLGLLFLETLRDWVEAARRDASSSAVRP
jgi:lipopolysaccharide biosynthesis protein